MESINFFLTTDVSIGIGLFKNASKNLLKMGFNYPLILYDLNLNQSDYFNENIEKINKAFPKGFNLINEFKGEPTYGYLEELRNKVKKNKPDLVIAIGGGSTMDLGKGIALLLNNDVPALSLKGFPEKVNKPIPLVTIPSIFGSGSEVSYNAVFIDENEGKKLGINSRINFPIKTIMDPLLTITAPIKSVTASALDSLVHCVDSYGSPKSSPISRALSIEGFKQTFNTLLNLDINKPESRLHLAFGSVCGINALMNSGDGPTNGFAYYFGVKDKIPHGLAGAIFLKEVMKWNFTNGYKEYYKFSLDDVDDKEQKNNKLFEELDELYIKLDIPNLSFYGYEASSIEDLVNNTAGALEGSFSGNPIQFNEQSIKEVLFKLI